MVRGAERLPEDKDGEESRRERSRSIVHHVARNAITTAPKAHANRDDDGVGDPDARSENLERLQKDEIGSRWSELEKVQVNALTAQHPLGIHPEEGLIAAKEYRRRREDERPQTVRRPSLGKPRLPPRRGMWSWFSRGGAWQRRYAEERTRAAVVASAPSTKRS